MLSFKNWFGPNKASNEEYTRRGEREVLAGSRQQRDFEAPEMTEKKWTVIQPAGLAEERESSSTKERSSTDSRRKDSMKGKAKFFVTFQVSPFFSQKQVTLTMGRQELLRANSHTLDMSDH
jgi:hypothetical protein